MNRPTRPLHDGTVDNPNRFRVALQQLQMSGPTNFTTTAGTPFTAQAYVATKGLHPDQDCILITRDADPRAYIYECCWGHVTNCTRTYIDVYSPHL
jgi:hypothetical protein